MTAGEQARTAPDAWARLTGCLRAVFVTLAADRGASDLMTTRLPDVEVLRAVRAHHRRTADILLGRARDQGVVRPDATAEDLLSALGRAVPPLGAAATPDAWHLPKKPP